MPTRPLLAFVSVAASASSLPPVCSTLYILKSRGGQGQRGEQLWFCCDEEQGRFGGRGFWGGVLNEKELDACFRVTRVYSKRFENPENLFGVYSPQSSDYRIYIVP